MGIMDKGQELTTVLSIVNSDGTIPRWPTYREAENELKRLRLGTEQLLTFALPIGQSGEKVGSDLKWTAVVVPVNTSEFPAIPDEKELSRVAGKISESCSRVGRVIYRITSKEAVFELRKANADKERVALSQRIMGVARSTFPEQWHTVKYLVVAILPYAGSTGHCSVVVRLANNNVAKETTTVPIPEYMLEVFAKNVMEIEEVDSVFYELTPKATPLLWM